MNQGQFDILSQEIRDVLLYNQDKSLALKEELTKLMSSSNNNDYAFEQDISKQLSFLHQRGINIEVPTNHFDNDDSTIGTKYNHTDLEWKDIVDIVRKNGYNAVKIEDILSHEEIKNACDEYENITKKFSDVTKLTKLDLSFLSIALFLQVIRQYFWTPLTEHVETKLSNETDEEFKKKYDNGGKLGSKYYYASMDTILNYKTVPYDVSAGSKQANLAGKNKGIGGVNHRYYTLGHDPALYSIFGTANILTNTITIYNGRSFHVKYRTNKSGQNIPTIVEEANTPKMLKKAVKRLKDSGEIQFLFIRDIKKGTLPSKESLEKLIDSFAPTAAFAKARMHLSSDASKNGLPIPFAQLFSPDFAKELAEYGFDAAGLKQIMGDTFKQASASTLINYFISILHGYICKTEANEQLLMTQVRTKKILLISNLLATSSNIVMSAIATTVSILSGNPTGANFARKHTDIGGIFVSLLRTFSDLRFIGAVRDDFVKNQMDEALTRIFTELDELERRII